VYLRQCGLYLSFFQLAEVFLRSTYDDMMLRPLLPRCGRALRASATRPSQLTHQLTPALQQAARCYSVKPQAASTSKVLDLDSSKLSITQTKSPKTLVDPANLVFGREFTDHMLTIEWTASDGWLTPNIVPYQNLSLDPATCVFHYSFEAFEGMKAYKDAKGDVRLFRPDKNMERMNRSAARIALPTFSPTAMIDLIAKFAKLEQRFIPDARGYSLYLRPTIIGTQKTLGVGAPGGAPHQRNATPRAPEVY
jgi:branched-chain amino acid aminotransferase